VWQWLRRSFITGFFVTVPLVISIGTFVWIFRAVDGYVSESFRPGMALFGRSIPGLGLATTALLVLLVGALATNVLGKRVLQRAESYLLRVPVFRTIYSPVKQIVAAFSPDNEFGFKRVVLVQQGDRGYVLGFLTKEFTVDRGEGAQAMLAVYVPTNHLYLGDVIICERHKAAFPDITVEEGVRIFLTGGMAMAARLKARDGADRVADFRV
jgi:uncharacterized membrane protein